MKNMNLKALFLMTVFLGVLYAEVSYVLSVQGASIEAGATSRAQFNDTNGAVFNAQAGNVTELTISGSSITTHWAGFYGNITGNITLADSSGNTFYNWVGLGVSTGEVFAANQSLVDWAGIQCANATHMSSFNTFLGAEPTDPDRVETTYNLNNHPTFTVADTSLTANTCNTTNAYSSGALDTGLFTQVILTDGLNVPVFTTLINDSSTGFNDNLYDFQLLAGARDTGVTPLYFYIELG